MIDRQTIQAMAAKIAERFRPQRVVLFGSYARGEATEDSDVDLLVVMERPGPRGKRSAPIIRMLAEEYALPVDVVVRSSEAIERWEDVANSVSRRILEEGIVLYERGK
jgi:predicted nucleotidyltransferase